MASTISVTVTSPAGNVPNVSRPFEVTGTVAVQPQTGHTLTRLDVGVTFGDGGPRVAATLQGRSWRCSGAPNPDVRPGSVINVRVHASAALRFFHNPSEPDVENIDVTTSFAVRVPGPVPPNLSIDNFASPIATSQLPLAFTLSGTTSPVQSPVQVVQYKVENGAFANAINVSGNWAQWRVPLPVPPGAHLFTVRAIDGFGTTATVERALTVQADPPIVVPPGTKTTLVGVPTTSSVTTWTRLEPQGREADVGTSSGARVFDPLWMLTRQWQMGEFQGEDAGTPVKARVRATSATLTRCHVGELPGASIQAPLYDPTRTPLEVVVARRRMRAANARDARMLTFAVEAGLHFLRMLEQQALSKNYRAAFLAKLALPPLSEPAAATADEATARFVDTMRRRAPDGRLLADILRTSGVVQLANDPALQIAAGDRLEVQEAAALWLKWYDSVCSEPEEAARDAWIPSRLEYALSVATRLSAGAADDLTWSATEFDGGPLDWSSFDVDAQTTLGTAGDRPFAPIVEATIPSIITFPGQPAPRFWEMEDARIAYGLVPVGPTDLAQMLMIEYASSYGNDWFTVPLTIPVGSVTRVESLVVTDTFGVRSLLRPMGDPALPSAFFSMWQSSVLRAAGAPVPAAPLAVNRFFLPPTLGRTLDCAPLEDILFMRDEMANVAWAIERSVESPLERPAPRDEAAGVSAPPPDIADGASDPGKPRYLLASTVRANWIPLLPVQVTNNGRVTSMLKRGAVLQPDATHKPHQAVGDLLRAVSPLLLFDEEVPRAGVHVTRHRRLTRWTDGSTWLWTSLRKQAGTGEGSSGLQFDRLIEPPPSRE